MVSIDHKPSDLSEIKRVAKAGGDVYISTIKQVKGLNGQAALSKVDRIITHDPESGPKVSHSDPEAMKVIEAGGEVCGPHRVIPGRLSVS